MRSYFSLDNEISLTQTLRRPEVKAELGAPSDRTFESCNMQINQAFQFNGDGASSAILLRSSLTLALGSIAQHCGVDTYASRGWYSCPHLRELPRAVK